MKIEEIKQLCATKLDHNEDYFSINTYKEALSIAIEALDHTSVVEVADEALEKIKNLFD